MSLHGNILTTQTSSTGHVIANGGRLVGLFVSVNSTAAGAILALQDTTGTTLGTTFLTIKLAPAIRNDWIPIPSDGQKFKNGVTASQFANLTSVTFSFQ